MLLRADWSYFNGALIKFIDSLSGVHPPKIRKKAVMFDMVYGDFNILNAILDSRIPVEELAERYPNKIYFEAEIVPS